MYKYLCGIEAEGWAPGESLEAAFDNFRSSYCDSCSVDDCTFYELSRELKVEQKIVEVEKLVISKSKKGE